MRHYFAGIVKINQLRHRVALRKMNNRRGTCLYKQIIFLITLFQLILQILSFIILHIEPTYVVSILEFCKFVAVSNIACYIGI